MSITDITESKFKLKISVAAAHFFNQLDVVWEPGYQVISVHLCKDQHSPSELLVFSRFKKKKHFSLHQCIYDIKYFFL